MTVIKPDAEKKAYVIESKVNGQTTDVSVLGFDVCLARIIRYANALAKYKHGPHAVPVAVDDVLANVEFGSVLMYEVYGAALKALQDVITSEFQARKIA